MVNVKKPYFNSDALNIKRFCDSMLKFSEYYGQSFLRVRLRSTEVRTAAILSTDLTDIRVIATYLKWMEKHLFNNII